MMKRLPLRQSLVSQTADYLRDALRRGVWSDFLPGHRALCAELQVSTYTLNLALHVLQREGLLQIAQGRRIRIIRHKSTQRPPSRTVVMLMPRDPEELEPHVYYQIAKLQRHLQTSDLDLHLHIDPRLQWQNLSQHLEDLVAQKQAACWILDSVSPLVQRWFRDRELPVLLSGSPQDGIHLPGVAMNSIGLCRDAAKKFLNYGHRHVVLLTFKSGIVGDEMGDQAFLDAFQEKKSTQIRTSKIYHDRSVSGICRAVDAILNSPHRVTGILSAGARHSLTVMSHLLRRGIRIPQEISIITRAYEPYLHDAVPALSGYEIDKQLLISSFSRQIVTLARTGVLPRRTKWIDWRFIPGETLGRIPPQNE